MIRSFLFYVMRTYRPRLRYVGLSHLLWMKKFIERQKIGGSQGEACEWERRGSSPLKWVEVSDVSLPPHSSKRLARTFSVCHFLFRTRSVNNGKDCSRIWHWMSYLRKVHNDRRQYLMWFKCHTAIFVFSHARSTYGVRHTGNCIFPLKWRSIPLWFKCIDIFSTEPPST